MSKHRRVLFVLKKNQVYGGVAYAQKSSGLFNSTNFIVQSLAARGIHTHIVEVVDNNDIDREVKHFKPDRVVIEALWVIPSKFEVLTKLHPHVKWHIHMHSGLPFLALEGIAMEWLQEYAQRGIGIIANSEETFEAFREILPYDKVDYLPNVYRMREGYEKFPNRDKHILRVGCFGAIRPMKNQLVQALAAIKFCNDRNLELHFHINATRVETNGSPVLKNLRALFLRHLPHVLIEHHWHNPEEFLYRLQFMDIGMQVSMTETFNVVSADYVTAGVPVVASDEIRWLSCMNKAKTDDIDDICNVMGKVYKNSNLVRLNQWYLKRYSKRAEELWYRWVNK